MIKTRHGSSKTLAEDLHLAYIAALKGEFGRWRERLILWHGIDVISPKELIEKRKSYYKKS